MERAIKMRKEIFENEAEAIQFYNLHCVKDSGIIKFLQSLKSFNMIKKSIVEEVEEMFLMWDKTGMGCKSVINENDLIIKQNEAIQYLKKQLEEK